MVINFPQQLLVLVIIWLFWESFLNDNIALVLEYFVTGEENGNEIQQGKQGYKKSADRGKEGTRCHQGQDEQHNQDIIYSNVKDVKIEQMKL